MAALALLALAAAAAPWDAHSADRLRSALVTAASFPSETLCIRERASHSRIAGLCKVGRWA